MGNGLFADDYMPNKTYGSIDSQFKRIGTWKEFNKKTGTLSLIETYDNGILNGSRIEYDENGNPFRVTDFSDGKIISVTNYQDGHICCCTTKNNVKETLEEKKPG